MSVSCRRATGSVTQRSLDSKWDRQQTSLLAFVEGYRSGQTGQTVNLLAMPSQVRILPPPPQLRAWATRIGSLPTRPAFEW